MDQAGKGGGGSMYGSTANGSGIQDDNGKADDDGDSMAKEKPSDLCRAEGEAEEEVIYVVCSS